MTFYHAIQNGVQFHSLIYFLNFYIVFLATADYECETIIYHILLFHHLTFLLVLHKCFSFLTFFLTVCVLL